MAILFNPAQLREIKKIIAKYHDAFIVNVIGEKAVDKEVLAALKKQGLVSTKVNSIKDAYLYGQLLATLQDKKVANMDYADFKRYIQKNPIPLTPVEQRAVEVAEFSAGQYCAGLGNTIDTTTNALLIEADKKLRAKLEGEIKEKVAENIARRQTVQELKTELGWSMEDWTRDLNRIAITEKQAAMQEGVADHFRKRYGPNVLVAKRPMPDACEWCKNLHLGPDGQPRIFPLSVLEANGTNKGVKGRNNWKAVIGPVHPHCQCQMVRVPAGWGFDKEGDIVPGGTLGVHYDSESDLEMALLQEHDLRKSIELQGHVDYQGIPISIENKKGSVRKWKDSEGNTGEVRFSVGYGYIDNTLGTDQDAIDCFIGTDPRAANVYIIEQKNPHTGAYDEQKCMIGFSNQRQAELVYRSHYDFPESFFLYTTPMPVDQFKRWIKITETKPGEMMAKGLRLVIPLNRSTKLEKAEVLQSHGLYPVDGAANAPIGNRAPSPGTAVNYVMDVPKKKPRKKKPKRELVDLTEIDKIASPVERKANSRDKDVYTVRETVRMLYPIKVPDMFIEANKEARIGHEERNKYYKEYPMRNVVASKAIVRTPVKDDN